MNADELRAVDQHHWDRVRPELELLARSLDARSLAELLGPSRELRASRARHAIWARLRELDQEVWTFPRIGRIFGGRHHTTVMFGVVRHQLGRPPCNVVRATRSPIARSA